MALKKRPVSKNKPKIKRKRALDAEDRIAALENKTVKKHKKLERALHIQEARKRSQAITEAGSIHVDEIKRALSKPNSSEKVRPATTNADVGDILSSLGVSGASNFAWSSEDESSSDSLDGSDVSEGEFDGRTDHPSSFSEDVQEESEEEEEEESDDDMSDTSSVESCDPQQMHEKITFPPGTEFSDLDQELLGNLMNDRDVIVTSEAFHKCARSTYLMVSAHALSHVLHKCWRVEKNSKKLRKRPDMELRDQGPNRARVLWLAPFRANAYEVIRNWVTVLNIEEPDGNLKSFLEEYEGQDERNEHSKNWEDWRRELFKGHYDDANYDDFIIGVTFYHGRFKLQFIRNAESLCGVDVIIASPLALSRISAADKKSNRIRDKFLRAQAEQADQESSETELVPVMDFLTGIEMLVVDRIDALAMQNWYNCCDIVSRVSSPAIATVSADINRIEEKFLTPESACAARQNILLAGSIMMDEYLSLPLRHDRVVRVGTTESSGIALHKALKLKIKQQFFIRVPGCLLDHFKSTFWKEVGNEIRQLIVVVADTEQLAPLLEFFDEEGIVDCCLSETTLSDIGGKRRKQMKSTLKSFREGDIRVIVVTERLLWYQRIRITGGRHVVFFGAPKTDSVYSDILADIQDPMRCSSTCIFKADERTALERIVGSKNIDRLVPAAEAAGELPGKSVVFTP